MYSEWRFNGFLTNNVQLKEDEWHDYKSFPLIYAQSFILKS